MKNLLLLICLSFASIAMVAQNDFSVDGTFTYTENVDFDNQYLENLSTGGVALIDTNQVIVIDSDGAVNAVSPITIPSGWNYVDQNGVDQMSTFYDSDFSIDCAVFYNNTDLLKVNLTTGGTDSLLVTAGIPEIDDAGDITGALLTFDVIQVTHAFSSFYLVSYNVFVDGVYDRKTVGLFDMEGSGTYASDIFENYITGDMGDYDRIVYLQSDEVNSGSFLTITNNLITDKIDYSVIDSNGNGSIEFSDTWTINLDNTFAGNYNSLGIINAQSIYNAGGGRCLVIGDIGANQFTVLESNGTIYSSFTYPPYLVNSQATITDVDVYDSSQGTTDFDPTNTHAIAMTFQASNYLSPAPYGLSIFDAQGCPWQFFANSSSGSCVFNSQGLAGEGLNLNGLAKGIQFDSNGKILVSGGDFETFNQAGSNTVFRIGGFESGSILILGCDDILASNYDPSATFNDGTCDYSAFNLICYASVNADSTVTINWAEGSTEFSDFRIYRESGSVGVFDLVSTVNDGDDLMRSYNDTGVNAFVQEHRYKVVGLLTASDTTSGNTPLANLSLVAERGTIKLNSLPDIDSQIVLTWNAPANTPLTSYYIVETDTETVIDTVSSNVLSYTVISPSVAGDYYISFDAPACVEGNSQSFTGNIANNQKSNKNRGTNKNLVDGLVRSNADNVIRGCTYQIATNYDPLATSDNGSCILDCEDDCPTDINNDGVTDAGDLLMFLGGFGNSCDGSEFADNNLRSEGSLESVVKSVLDEIVFSQDVVQLREPMQFDIYSVSGQLLVSKFSDQINFRQLSSGTYIIVTERDSRYFVIQN